MISQLHLFILPGEYPSCVGDIDSMELVYGDNQSGSYGDSRSLLWKAHQSKRRPSVWCTSVRLRVKRNKLEKSI